MEIEDRTVEVSVAEIVAAAEQGEMEELIEECYGHLSTRRFILAVSGCIDKSDAEEIAENCGVELAGDEEDTA